MANYEINLVSLVEKAQSTLDELKGACTAAQDVLQYLAALRDGHVGRDQAIRYFQDRARQCGGENNLARDVYYSALGEIGY